MILMTFKGFGGHIEAYMLYGRGFFLVSGRGSRVSIYGIELYQLGLMTKLATT